MARNLKKFVNPKFIRTVDLTLLRRLLDRHRGEMPGFDFAVFEGGPGRARDAVTALFLGPEADCPEGLVIDIHHLAELGCAAGLDLLIAEARRRGVQLIGHRSAPTLQDPKHVALVAYLDHRAIFNVAADRMAFLRTPTLTELLGRDIGVSPMFGDAAIEEFRRTASEIFQADLHGDLCRVTWYRDEDEVVLVVTHSQPIVTAPVIENGRETTTCWRPLHQARMAYVANEGRLKIGGVSKLRRARLAEAFGRSLLECEGQFSGAKAFDLYSLEPIEKSWPEVRLSHQFDQTIERVRVVQAQVDRVVRDLLGTPGKPLWSLIVSDETEDAFARLRESRSDLDFRGGWRLGMVRMRSSSAASGAGPQAFSSSFGRMRRRVSVAKGSKEASSIFSSAMGFAMSETLLTLLLRLSEADAPYILPGSFAAPHRGPVFERLLVAGVIEQLAPLSAWPLCDDCECGQAQRAIRLHGDALIAECPIDPDCDVALSPVDVEVFKIDPRRLVLQATDSGATELMPGLWRLGDLPDRSAGFLTLSRRIVDDPATPAALRGFSGSGRIVFVAPRPAEAARRAFAASADIVLIQATDAFVLAEAGSMRLDPHSLSVSRPRTRLLVDLRASKVDVDGVEQGVPVQPYQLLCLLLEAFPSRKWVGSGKISAEFGRDARDLVRDLKDALAHSRDDADEIRSWIQNKPSPSRYRLALPSDAVTVVGFPR